MFVYRGSDLTDVSIVRKMPNIQTLSLRQVFAIVADMMYSVFYKLHKPQASVYYSVLYLHAVFLLVLWLLSSQTQTE